MRIQQLYYNQFFMFLKENFILTSGLSQINVGQRVEPLSPQRAQHLPDLPSKSRAVAGRKPF
jgi:hypothetical protein